MLHRTCLFLTPFLLILSSAYADRSIPLIEMHSSPVPAIDCVFSIIVDRNNDLTGASSTCHGEDLASYGVDRPKYLSLGQLKRGFVFMRHTDYGVNIITVSGPDLDPARGGPIRIHYLKNAMFMAYGDYMARIEKIGDRWVAYSDDRDGRKPITQMRVRTGTLGVKSIRAD